MNPPSGIGSDDDKSFQPRGRLSCESSSTTTSYHSNKDNNNNDRAYPLSQQSQTPPPRGRDSTSTAASPGSGSPIPQTRRTIVHLNLSSQSDDDDDDDEENEFAKLESFLQGKFENDNDDENKAKLDTGRDTDTSTNIRRNESTMTTCRQHQPEENDSSTGTEKTNHGITTTSSTSSPPLHKLFPQNDADNDEKAVVTLQTAKVTAEAKPTVEQAPAGANVIGDDNDDDEFPLPDDSPGQPSQSQTTSPDKRFCENHRVDQWHTASSTTRRTQYDDYVEDDDNAASDRLLECNRKANQKLRQKQQVPQSQKRQNISTTSTNTMTDSRPVKKSRIVPSSQSSLVGSLPQRWMKSFTGFPSSANRTCRSTVSGRPASMSGTRNAAAQNSRITMTQSTPAWRQRPPSGRKRTGGLAPATLPRESSTNDQTTLAPSKSSVTYKPFAAANMTSQLQTCHDNDDDDGDDDAITDVPETTPDLSSPSAGTAQQQQMWWGSTTTAVTTPSKSPHRASSKQRGPLLAAFRAAKDRWNADRLRLYNSTAATSSTTTSLFSFLSNPLDDPRRKAKSCTDVTILGPGRSVTNGAYWVHLVWLHQHNSFAAKEGNTTVNGDDNDTTADPGQVTAWGCFPRGQQQPGEAVRIYNAVVTPWSTNDGDEDANDKRNSNVPWIVMATQVYEPCPGDDLPPVDSILERINNAAEDSVGIDRNTA